VNRPGQLAHDGNGKDTVGQSGQASMVVGVRAYAHAPGGRRCGTVCRATVTAPER